MNGDTIFSRNKPKRWEEDVERVFVITISVVRSSNFQFT